MATTTWRIAGEQFTVCNCAWGCPCQFNAPPTRGRCQAWIGFEVREGRYGDVDLQGLRAAAAASWPGAIHEGNGQIQPVVDARATPAQREALLAILGGQEGGPFSIYVAMCSKVHAPKYLPIHFESDREARRGRLSAMGVGEARAVPIVNPVTGEEHRARIDLPNGFEYRVAEVGDAEQWHAQVGDEQLAFEHTYAQFNAFDWRNG